MIKPIQRIAAIYVPLFSCILIAFSSCKKDQVNPAANTTTTAANLKIANADYVWGDMAINKKTESDVIKYNTVGNIDNVSTYDSNGNLINNITFTYNGNKITLNTAYNDEYDLDSSGKVIYHSYQEVQNGHNITEIQRFAYDANNYLNKVMLSLNFDGNVGAVYSVIDYEVKNGNYTKYSLSNTDSGTVTRQYLFTYNTSKTVNSPCAFFAPIFANDTYSNIDKYLNYGKASVNLLTGLSYSIRNLDKSISTGSFNVVTNVNTDNYITSLNLAGSDPAGFPSDNLSPLPRSISFTLK